MRERERDARIGFSRLPKADVILPIEGWIVGELPGSAAKSLYGARVIAIVVQNDFLLRDI